MKTYSKLFVLAGALAMLLPGCTVDKNYTADKIKNLDSEMTMFENGLIIPLIKSTTELRADSLINSIEDPEFKKLFKSKDGKYEIKLTGHENLDSFIKELGLADAIKIDPVNFESNFTFKFGDLDPDKFKSDPVHFGEEASLPDLSAVKDIKINPISETINVDAGIKGKDLDIPVSVEDFQRNQAVFTKSQIIAAGIASSEETVTFPTSQVTLNVSSKSVSAFTIPSSIKQINSVSLKDNARVVVSLSLSNSVFTEGTVTPNVTINLSDLLTFSGDGSIDLSSMVLNKSNGFATSKSFPITGVNIAKLAQSKSISISGTLDVAGAKATKTGCASATGDLGVNFSISFPDLGIESVNCALNDISANVDKNVQLKMDEITLPKVVKSVDFATFTSDSKVTMKISATNLDKISGAAMKANTVKVTFPEGLEVSGTGVTNNVLVLSDVNLATGKDVEVKVSKLTLPAPVGGKISYSPNIRVEASCTANGTINTSDIKKLTSDVAITANVASTLKIADFQATNNKYESTIPTTQGKISFEVPDKAASYGEFTITPEGTPNITLKMTVPDLGSKTVAADGIKIKLPKFIVLGSFSYPELTYADNTITINQIKDKTFTLPVEKLVAKAEKNPTSGKYEVTGNYEIVGAVSIAQGTVKKADIEKIDRAKLGFTADVPSIKASKIKVETLSFDVNEKVDFEMLKSKDIPDMLVSVGEVILKDVKANLGLEASGMPSIGSKSKFIVDLKAELPSFIDPSTLYIKGEIKNGKFTNPAIDVKGFNLSEFDFPKMKKDGESLKGSVKITGKIFAEDPEVELSTLSGEVNGKFKASICDSDKKIKIKSLGAKIDYKIDTTFFVNTMDLKNDLKDYNFNLPDISAILGMKTNLAVPATAKASVTPIKDGKEVPSIAISRDLVFPYCPKPADTDTVTNNLTLNVNDILNSRCDSLKLDVELKTDKTKDCYIEPDATYSLGLGYEVSIPLQPRSDFKIVLADTLDLEGGLDGLEEILSRSKFGITGDVENTFPLGVKISFDFLNYDKDKQTYSVIPLEAVETELLEPSKESSFEIITGPTAPGTKLPEITNLRITCTLTADGKAVAPSSYIKIKNLTIVLPEGITIDPANN